MARVYIHICFIIGVTITDYRFNVEAMVCEYHIYQSVWDAAMDGGVSSY